ncbi:MAG: hypothetical protein LCH54_00305 [Bacteroidetes bacterium]|nr:hypothetical protein [Bacteroidota bacterium]
MLKSVLLSSVLVFFIFTSCSESPKTEFSGNVSEDLSLNWRFSYQDSSVFSEQAFSDQGWDVFFSGRADSLTIATSIPQVPWQRISWSGRADSLAGKLRFSELAIETHDSAAVSFFTGSTQTDIKPFLIWNPAKGQLFFAIKPFLIANPDLQFIAIKNLPQSGKTPQLDQRMMPFSSGSPEKLIEDERYARIIKTMQRMDSLLVDNDINGFTKFLAGDFFEDGISRSDKINFYKYIGVKMTGMHFDYGNFLFDDLKDGRIKMMYQYNLWKGDSLVDAGSEARYFRLTGNKWKETGSQKRFYPAVLSAKIMRYDREFYIYLPPTYFSNPESRYPVIYVFNDATDRTVDWVAYRFNELMDKAIKSGKVKPAIVIFMDGGPSAYMTGIDKDKSYDFEQFFMSDVGPNYDLTLRTIPDREHRFLTGFGQGGLAAMYYGLKYPTVFSSIATVNGRLTQSLMSKLVDGGDPEFWTTIYPAWFLNKMPDYILDKLNFTLLQQKGGQQMKDYTATKDLLESRKARLKAKVFDNIWQENMDLIINEAFGGHLSAKP